MARQNVLVPRLYQSSWKYRPPPPPPQPLKPLPCEVFLINVWISQCMLSMEIPVRVKLLPPSQLASVQLVMVVMRLVSAGLMYPRSSSSHQKSMRKDVSSSLVVDSVNLHRHPL